MASLRKIHEYERTNGALAGWRNWLVDEDSRLASTGFGRQTWPPGINEASCIYNHAHDDIAPVDTCECGIYARFQLDNYSNEKQKADRRKTIPGLIAGRGRIQIHKDGFRSAEMQILALLNNTLLTPKEIYEISKYYEVSFFDSVYDILKHFQKNAFLHFSAISKIIDLEDIKPRKTFDHEGYLHSYNDTPAEVTSYGTKNWYKHGKLHRTNGPAEVYLNGFSTWYKEGLIHREDGPAQIYPGGPEIWFQNNLVHRDDGPAVIEEGHREWYQRGQLHRDDDLPAIIYSNGQKEWWQNNEKHRRGKPAVTRPDGPPEYYEKGTRIPERNMFGVSN